MEQLTVARADERSRSNAESNKPRVEKPSQLRVTLTRVAWLSILFGIVIELLLIAARVGMVQTEATVAELAGYYRRIIRTTTDLEAFARVVEFAARQTDGDYDAFMLDLNRLILAARNNRTAIVTGFLDRAKLRFLNRLGCATSGPRPTDLGAPALPPTTGATRCSTSGTSWR